MNQDNISSSVWNKLSQEAWKTRDNAYLIGKTKVGAALISDNDHIYSGCNVEHIYRCHDVHAEVNAISNMVAQGEHNFKAILVAAERKKFTPCGGCMDWIMQHGGEECWVAYQNEPNSEIYKFKAKMLMPEYPR